MNVIPSRLADHSSKYRHLSTRFEPQYGALWCCLAAHPRPCFSFEVLGELRRFQENVTRSANNEGKGWGVRYVILASVTPGVFNFGGDLRLFIRCLKENDPETLRRYAKACIDVLYRNYIGHNLPLTTISLVQGECLGGGFEAALSSDVLIAEKSSRFGFPEIIFNLFPGMGAYSFLERRIGQRGAEELITSGKIFSAEEMAAQGVVDLVADNGNGEAEVAALIQRRGRSRNGLAGLAQVRRRVHRIDFSELLDVVQIWVDSALRLSSRDLKLMQRLVSRQNGLNESHQIH